MSWAVAPSQQAVVDLDDPKLHHTISHEFRIISTRITPLFIHVHLLQIVKPLWLWVPSLDKPTIPSLPLVHGVLTPGLPLASEADRATPAEHAEGPGSLAQEIHLHGPKAKWFDL